MQDLDTAHLRGRIYKVRDRWRCTSHGDPLSEVPGGKGHLRATCCSLEVRP